MAKPRHGPKQETKHLVKAVATVLIRGEPTLFRFEAYCRHRLRWHLCLAGFSWARSDATAADIVRQAMALLNVTRPPWLWGQREYTQDTVGTRVSFSHCVQCGARLPEGRLKFCASSCGDKYRAAFQTEAFRSQERERARAYLQARRDAAEPKQCETCDAWFKPAKSTQKFCSVRCAGHRSVEQKMNGKAHPWVNGHAKTGAGGASIATHSSPSAPINGSASAISSARAAPTRPFSHASEPRTAPS